MGYKKKQEGTMSYEWKHPSYYKELAKVRKELEENSEEENKKKEEQDDE